MVSSSWSVGELGLVDGLSPGPPVRLEFQARVRIIAADTERSQTQQYKAIS